MEKGNHLFSGQAVPVGLEAQPNSFSLRRNQQHAQEIKTLVMVDAGADDRRLAAASPAALKRRDQREAAFIFESPGSAQLPTLFLSWAVLLPSSAQWLRHPAGGDGVAVADCSNPSDPSHARRSSGDSGLQTIARSLGRSGRASNSFQHIRRHTLLDPEPFPAFSLASRIISWVAQADE